MAIKRIFGYAAEFNSADSHFYIPISIRYEGRILNADFLLDTGATKCSIPLTVNKEILKLPITGTDRAIQIAGGRASYNYVRLERLEIPDTRLFAMEVDAWLADDFILGMNFLSKFSFKVTKASKLIIEK